MRNDRVSLDFDVRELSRSRAKHFFGDTGVPCYHNHRMDAGSQLRQRVSLSFTCHCGEVSDAVSLIAEKSRYITGRSM